MATPVELTQDIAFINKIRQLNSGLLDITDQIFGLKLEWDNMFGGEFRLLEASFINGNEGLEKADISAVLDDFVLLNTWLNTYRVALEKIRIS